MKKIIGTGEQLQTLVTTLEAENSIKRDYVANSKTSLHFVDGNLVIARNGAGITYEPTPHFHSQVATKLDIPAGYYKKMLTDSSKLLDENVNHWLDAASKNFLVRTFDRGAESFNTARAFLSDSYSIIDNYQILMEALESIKQTGVRVEVINAELSDTRMYLKVVAPEVEINGKKLLQDYSLAKKVGMGVISGFTLQNSEIGAGAFQIMPRAVVLACTNGMTLETDALRNIHLGGKMTKDLDFHKNKNVMAANLKLIREQIKHAVKIFLSKEYLTKLMNVYTELGQPKIEAPVQNVIEVVGKEFRIADDRKANILKYFIEGGDTRRIGLASAMTRECQELENADLKHETEVASFHMLKSFARIEAAAMKMDVKRSQN